MVNKNTYLQLPTLQPGNTVYMQLGHDSKRPVDQVPETIDYGDTLIIGIISDVFRQCQLWAYRLCFVAFH